MTASHEDRYFLKNMKNGVLIGQKIEFISFKRCAVRCGVILSDFCVLAGYIAVLKGGPVGNDWLPFSQNTSSSPSPDSQPGSAILPCGNL
jgi:hypothetical protein